MFKQNKCQCQEFALYPHTGTTWLRRIRCRIKNSLTSQRLTIDAFESLMTEIFPETLTMNFSKKYCNCLLSHLPGINNLPVPDYYQELEWYKKAGLPYDQSL